MGFEGGVSLDIFQKHRKTPIFSTLSSKTIHFVDIFCIFSPKITIYNSYVNFHFIIPFYALKVENILCTISLYTLKMKYIQNYTLYLVEF